MIRAYRHLYQRIEVLTMDGQPGGIAWVIKLPDNRPWYEHLLPAHRKFFDSLEPVTQLVVSLSCDPFQALKQIWISEVRG